MCGYLNVLIVFVFFLEKLERSNQFVSSHQERSICDSLIGAF